jgi:parallel beta-helix repeat protein
MKNILLTLLAIVFAICCANAQTIEVQKQKGVDLIIKVIDKAEEPVPIPPPTNVINVQPGQSIKAAVESAAAGKTVLIAQGSYSEPNINVPVGVNILGNGVVAITASTYGAAGSAETGLFILRSSAGTQGNQTIANLTLEGNNIGYGGIFVEGRDKVTIKNCIIRNFNFHGIWLRTVKDSEVLDNELNNTAWASSGYSSGQINIFALTNVNILRNKVLSNKNNKGTGIEALWKQSTMTNLKIMYNTFDLSHQNPWNNGIAKNFSIEIHDTRYNGIEIAFNTIKNQLSMASHFPATTTAKTLIHDNTGDLGGDTMFIENICDNLEAYNNTVTNALMFAANFQPNSVWKNNNFHNNTFTSTGAVSWGGMFLIGPLGVQSFVIKDNIFKLNGNVKVKYMGTTGGVTETNNTWQ